jgi:hypothetical protein
MFPSSSLPRDQLPRDRIAADLRDRSKPVAAALAATRTAPEQRRGDGDAL